MRRFPALAIIYYGFTIILGIILAFYFIVYGSNSKIASQLTSCSEKNDYYSITRILSVYQDKTPVLQAKLSDGTSFEVYMVDATYSTTVDSTTYYYIEKGYMGIINNPGSDWKRDSYTTDDGVTTNKFGLRFNGITNSNEEASYEYRIGYVENDSSISSDMSSIIQNRYYSYISSKFYFFMVGDNVFADNDFKEVDSITFVNNDKTDYETVNLDSSWKLESDFFTTVSTFNTEYNEMVSKGATTSDINAKADEFGAVIDANPNYSQTNYTEIIKYVPMQNTFKIIGYFLLILIIGDFLVGKHHIIHLFMRIFGKNSKTKSNEIPDYMQEYEVNVVFSAKVPEGFNKTITISYQSEEGQEVVFNLKKSGNYEDNIRVKNGIYSHPEIVAEGLECLDVPSTINIKGYKYSQEFLFTDKK